MSISNTTYQIQATGDGVTQTFSFPFKIFNATQLICTQINPAGGTPLGPYVLGTDYTVWINPVAEGGTVTWTIAPPLGYVVQLTRQVPYTQSAPLFPSSGNITKVQIPQTTDQQQSSIRMNKTKIIHINKTKIKRLSYFLGRLTCM